MKLELFKQDFKLYRSAHQAHLRYEFYVPKGATALTIYFNYGPFTEENPDELKEVFKRDGVPVELLKKDEAFRNLLTLSVNDAQTFRGAHHWFNGAQTIEINDQQASDGFVSGPVVEGNWQVIISCHGIFSPFVEGDIRVEAQLEEAVKPYRENPLYIKETEWIRKNRQREMAKTLTFKRMELHAHTIHSDAQQTTEELVTEAVKQGMDWVAVTDHNTITAIAEAMKLAQNLPLGIIPGLEFTTFYGHYLMHGAPEFMFNNWTDVNKANIGHYLERLKQNPINITIAHPYSEGNPYCTGCRWDYELESLKYVDSLEIWNKINPHLLSTNEQAYQLWQYLLSVGYEIAATVGRDWHRPHGEKDIPAFTYLLLPENAVLADVLTALNFGRSFGSWRAMIDRFSVDNFYLIGDRVETEEATISVEMILLDLLPGDNIQLWDQDQVLESFTYQPTENDRFEQVVTIPVADKRLIRLDVRNQAGQLVMFSNPIYIG